MAALIVLIWLAAIAAGVLAQTTGTSLPPLMIASMDGRDLYQFYCASCHGKSGRGDGPVGPALKTRPLDLTLIARGNGGNFPGERLRATLSGSRATSTAAHGPAEMPVWGPIFRALDPNDARTAVRLDNLVRYLESIQLK
jgi:mono/diheme cytochrome c family protein